MAVIEFIDGPTDLKKEMVTSTLARIFSSTQKVPVKDIDAAKAEELGLPKSLVRNLKKVQFANSLETIDATIEKKMNGL
jgi:hypothetical protein